MEPELTLLLGCSRPSVSPADLDRFAAVAAGGVNWGRLLSLGHVHGTSYFLARHLQESSELFAFLPASVLRQLKVDAWANAVRTAILLDYQQRLDAAFETASVRVIWLKGLSLSERLYGCAEARSSGDLDLLIEEGADEGAAACLQEQGFVRADGIAAGDAHPLAAHHRTWNAHVSEDRMVTAEVHHQWSGPPRQPACAELFARSRRVMLADRSIRVLGPEDELLSLCFHAYHHHFVLLRCLTDVVEFTHACAGQLDWTRLVEISKVCGGRGIVAATLAVAERILSVDLGRRELGQWTKLDGRRRWAVSSLSPLSLLDDSLRSDDLLEGRLTLLLDRSSDIVKSWLRRLWPSAAYVGRDCPEWARHWPLLPRARYYCNVIRHAVSSSH